MPNTPTVQSLLGTAAALGTLQELGRVWRASRGVHALEDGRLAEPMRREGMVESGEPR